MSDEIVKVPEEEKYPYNPRDRRKAMETELNLLLKAGGGVLTPDAVVEQAEDPTSALHSFFTWDDDGAACKWRLVEARQLITGIKILQEGAKGKMRSLVSLNVDRTHGGGYRSLEAVMASTELRQHLLETALAELNSIQRKYRDLQELQSVWGEVDTIKEEIAAGEPRKED